MSDLIYSTLNLNGAYHYDILTNSKPSICFSHISDLMDLAINENKNVDIVIANAGIIDEKNWRRCLDLNLVRANFYELL